MNGFTLMELMVVVALMMILSVVGIGTYTSATVKSKDTQRKNDLSQMVRAFESFYTDVGRYPLSKTNENYPHCYVKVGASITDPKCDGDRLYVFLDGERSIYISIPTDPEPGQSYVYVSTDGTSYSLYTALENSGDKDLLRDGSGNVIPDPYGISCGNVQCNYKVTETGLTKSL